MSPLYDVDTIVFDILGTLVDDTEGLRTALVELVSDAGRVNDLVALWGRRISTEHQFDLHLGTLADLTG